PTLRFTVQPHIGHFRQPFGRHFVEVLQGTELTPIEQAGFYEVEWPLHFTFRLWPPAPTGPDFVAVVCGEGEEAGVVDWLLALIAVHHDLHVIVEAGGG